MGRGVSLRGDWRNGDRLDIPSEAAELTSQTGFEKGSLSLIPFYPYSQASQMAQGPRSQKRSGEDGERLPPAVARNLLSIGLGRAVVAKIKSKILVSSLLFVVHTLQYRISSLQATDNAIRNHC